MGLAEVSFDVFITVDRNLSYQQNLSKYNVAMIVLKAISNRYIDLAPLAASAHNALQKIRPGESILISLD